MSVFGRVFRVSTWGESHGKSVGVVIDGIPAGLPLTVDDIQPQLSRRRPGQSALTTGRSEADLVEIQSGTDGGVTLGTPVAARVLNLDQRPADYSFQLTTKAEGPAASDGAAAPAEAPPFVPRPSHADYTYRVKYGVAASSGGGRSSARETVGRVIGGAVAEKLLTTLFPGLRIVAWVAQAGSATWAGPPDGAPPPTREEVDAHPVRCPDAAAAAEMTAEIAAAKAANDSVGGVVACSCVGVPAGLGDPVFDRLEAALAHAMLSIPATRGFEIGSGFAGVRCRGSAHNDAYRAAPGAPLGLELATNRSGGVQGGISCGSAVVFRVAFKPPATIGVAQRTAAVGGGAVVLEAKGRHDPCVVPRAVPIVEAMAALVLADAALLARTCRVVMPPLAAHPHPAAAAAAPAAEGPDAAGAKPAE